MVSRVLLEPGFEVPVKCSFHPSAIDTVIDSGLKAGSSYVEHAIAVALTGLSTEIRGVGGDRGVEVRWEVWWIDRCLSGGSTIVGINGAGLNSMLVSMGSTNVGINGAGLNSSLTRDTKELLYDRLELIKIHRIGRTAAVLSSGRPVDLVPMAVVDTTADTSLSSSAMNSSSSAVKSAKIGTD